MSTRTCFKCLDGNRGGAIPQARPHLPKVPLAELLQELESGSLYLPLVPAEEQTRQDDVIMTSWIRSCLDVTEESAQLHINQGTAYPDPNSRMPS